MQISEEEVLLVQQNWSNGVVEIGKKFDNNLDYISYAEEFLDKLYNFRNGDVLFKPTFASESQFRLNKASALSYFIGDNQEFNEDKGFALSCWESIRFENISIIIEGNIALAMGNYFMFKDGLEKKVEYSFVYKRDENGDLSIILHDSHLPYAPKVV
jgi:hypothetical protein